MALSPLVSFKSRFVT